MLCGAKYSATNKTFYSHKIKKHNTKLHAYLTGDAEEALRAARIQKRVDTPKITLSSWMEFQNMAQRQYLDARNSNHRRSRCSIFCSKASTCQRLIALELWCLAKRIASLAYGITTENPRLWTAHNPWDISRTPGGSSSGRLRRWRRTLRCRSGTSTGRVCEFPASLYESRLKPTFRGASVVLESVPLSGQVLVVLGASCTNERRCRAFAVK